MDTGAPLSKNTLLISHLRVPELLNEPVITEVASYATNPVSPNNDDAMYPPENPGVLIVFDHESAPAGESSAMYGRASVPLDNCEVPIIRSVSFELARIELKVRSRPAML